MHCINPIQHAQLPTCAALSTNEQLELVRPSFSHPSPASQVIQVGSLVAAVLVAHVVASRFSLFISDGGADDHQSSPRQLKCASPPLGASLNGL